MAYWLLPLLGIPTGRDRSTHAARHRTQASTAARPSLSEQQCAMLQCARGSRARHGAAAALNTRQCIAAKLGESESDAEIFAGGRHRQRREASRRQRKRGPGLPPPEAGLAGGAQQARSQSCRHCRLPLVAGWSCRRRPAQPSAALATRALGAPACTCAARCCRRRRAMLIAAGPQRARVCWCACCRSGAGLCTGRGRGRGPSYPVGRTPGLGLAGGGDQALRSGGLGRGWVWLRACFAFSLLRLCVLGIFGCLPLRQVFSGSNRSSSAATRAKRARDAIQGSLPSSLAWPRGRLSCAAADTPSCSVSSGRVPPGRAAAQVPV
jgi:hypothetical protein